MSEMKNSNSLTNLTLAAARDGLQNKDFSAVELCNQYIDAIENAGELNCFITKTPEYALAMAKKSDHKIQNGTAGSMEGLPIGMKDLFCTKGVLTTAGSHILDGFKPTYESTVSQNLWDSGAVMLGKMNMDEFAMGSANITSYYGNVINPWQRNDGSNAKLVPGGSSGGSAAAVASNIVIAATGTDTGGSIRQPAAFTGIVGLKPTYGRCSRWGTIAFASSLDQAGPMTRDVRDAAIMLGAMAGFDNKDSTSVNLPVPNYEAALTGDIKGMRIGIPKEYNLDGMPSEITELWQQGAKWLKDAGAEIVDISLPHTKYALPAYYIVAPAEASSNLARYDGIRYGLRVCDDGDSLDDLYEKTRAEGFGAEVQRRILIGTYVLSAGYYDAYYLQAQKVRTKIADDFKQAWQSCDILLTPVTPTAAFGIDEKQDDPLAMYLHDIFTVPSSMAGLPAMSIPAALDNKGLPLGLQLIAKPFDEVNLLRVGHMLENMAGFNAKPQFLASNGLTSKAEGA